MNIRFTLGTAAALCLWFSMPSKAQESAAKVVPRRESLSIPLTTGKPPRSVECVVAFGPSIPISALAFGPDGKTLAVGGYREVLVWDLAGAKLSKRIGAGEIGGTVRALAFLKNGKLLAVGEGTPHSSGAVRVFDTKSGKQTHSFEEPREVVHSLAVSPDGRLLAAAGAEVPVRVWNIDEQKLVATIKEHGDWVLDVSFSRDGKLLATAGADGTLKLWEVGTWKPEGKLVQAETVRGSAFSPDGRLLALAIGGPGGRSVQIHRKDSAKRTRRARPTRVLYTGAGMPMDVIWAAKGDRIYAPCSDKTVKAFDARNFRPVATFRGHGDWVYCAALSPDQTQLASGSADGTVKLFSAADGKLLATLVQLSPRAEEWLIVTALGYFATSSADALKWRTDKLKTPAEEIAGVLQKPELVRKVIAGEKTEPPALE